MKPWGLVVMYWLGFGTAWTLYWLESKVKRFLRGQDLPTVAEIGAVATGPCCCVESGMPSGNCGIPGHTPLGRKHEGLLLFRRGQFGVIQVPAGFSPLNREYFIACRRVAVLANAESWSGWVGADYARATFEQARVDVIYLAGKRGVSTAGWN